MITANQVAGIRNLMVNPSLSIWQRGTTSTSAFPWGADRWQLNASFTGTHTLSQSTDVPAGVPVTYSMKYTVTSADASVAATDICLIRYGVEGIDFLALRDQAWTFSFYVKGNAAGTYTVNFSNSAADKNYNAEYTISSAEASAQTWKRVSMTVPHDTGMTAGTWLYTPGTCGLGIRLVTMAGSNWVAPPNQWVYGTSSAKISSHNQTNLCATTNNYLQFAAFQLEAGPLTPFQPVPYAYDLLRCQRYCWGWNSAGGAFTTLCNGHTRTATTMHGFIQLPVPMAGWPTVAVSDHTHFRTDDGTGVFECSNLAINSGMTLNPQTISLTITHASATAQRAIQCLADNTLSAVFALTAEV